MKTVTLLLDDAQVRKAFDWQAAIDALELAYAGSAPPTQFPPRIMARGDGKWLRILSGIMPGQAVMGAKLIAASPATGFVSYAIPLFDGESMALAALIDGAAITGFRTAATSALAARRLAAQSAPRVAVIGSGFEARAHLEALTRTGPTGEIAVYSPREASRAAFREHMASQGVTVLAADSAMEAVAAADLVICAARSRDETPTIRGEWLRPGTTVVSIGSTLPEQRELDAESIERAALIVADMQHEVAAETGDMIEAAKAGVRFSHKIVGLQELVSGRHPGRTAPDQIVIYKSVGAAIQDLAVAMTVVERARELGIGASIRSPVQPVSKGK